jgi:hypothetical protein
MATTTPNYGWAVPTSTDLVKDGATAIETLGDAIDASMNTALGTKKAGMVLLNTTSFSGVTTQSVSDVFSSTYQNYKVLINLTSAASDTNFIRLRVSGADNSTANSYISERLNANSTTVTGLRNTSTQLLIGSNENSTNSVANLEIFSPNEVRPTQFLVQKHERETDGIVETSVYGGYHNQSVAYTGFTLIGTKSSSGTIRVYGYNQ